MEFQLNDISKFQYNLRTTLYDEGIGCAAVRSDAAIPAPALTSITEHPRTEILPDLITQTNIRDALAILQLPIDRPLEVGYLAELDGSLYLQQPLIRSCSYAEIAT